MKSPDGTTAVLKFEKARERKRSTSEQLRLAQKDLIKNLITDLQAYNLTSPDKMKVTDRRRQLSIVKDTVHVIKAVKSVHEDLTIEEKRPVDEAEQALDGNRKLMEKAEAMLHEADIDVPTKF